MELANILSLLRVLFSWRIVQSDNMNYALELIIRPEQVNSITSSNNELHSRFSKEDTIRVIYRDR